MQAETDKTCEQGMHAAVLVMPMHALPVELPLPGDERAISAMSCCVVKRRGCGMVLAA